MRTSASLEADTQPKPSAARPAAEADRRVARAAGIMVAAIFLSRVLGLVREMVMSYYFGAQVSPVRDAYTVAFRLPDLCYYLIAGGALSSAFIPVFTEYLEKGDEESAWKVFSVFGTVIVLGLAGMILLGEVLAEVLIGTFFAPGYSAEQVALAASITRIVLPSQVFFFLGGLMMSTLYARNRFLIPALGPLVYNTALIIGALLGGYFWGSEEGIFGQAWAALVGSFLGNVLMQGWEIRRVGVQYRPSLAIRHPGVVKVGKLMLPVLLGLSLPQLCMILTTPFLSYQPVGAVTWLGSANMVMQLPLGIFAQALGVAIFPTLSALAARQDMVGLRRQFSLGLRAILFMTIPSAVLIAVLALPLTALLFHRGLWTWEDTMYTADATVIYSLAIFAVSGQQLVNRGFYATQDTRTPMLVGTGATLGFLLLNWALVGPLQVNGLALSYVIINALTLFLLLALYSRRTGGLPLLEIGSSVGRVMLAALGMGVTVWGIRVGLDHGLHAYGPGGIRTIPLLLQLGFCGALGLAVYVALVRALRVPEAEFVFSTVAGRLQRWRGRRS